MKTLKKVEITPLFLKDSIPKELEENILYISEEYKTAIHLCLCGCKEKTITPLLGGQFWDLIKEKNGKVSLIGSIGNYSFPCQSHYIITNNIANFC